ncbi:MAG TPA: HlyD family efflux transporter periplasmic adaptor subunit [Vicinamibacterales bacterium]|jgi:HlyD family secretion protein
MFRKAAIDKVSSPEQLDLLMQVTSPIGWLALLTVGVVLIIAGFWSVLGSIPELVDGNGTLFRGERLIEVKAPASGRLLQFNVNSGMKLQAGQVIAKVKRDQDSIEQKSADQLTIAKNEAMVESKRGEIGNLHQQRNMQASLVAQGLKAANSLLDWDRRIIQAEGELNSIEKETRVLQARMSSTTDITTPEGGRVVEVIKTTGDSIREGEPMLRLEPDTTGSRRQFCGGNTHVILFVPAQLAGKVRPGQDAHVSPLDVKKEEYGYIVGKVEWISSYAASPEDMREKLKNDQLVKSFSGSGPVFEARVCLEADPKNKANGFRWSSSGPDKPIDTGGACTASLVVDSKQPYTYIIPMVRRTVGL